MKRRNFLISFLIGIVAFIFGYTIKNDGGNLIWERISLKNLMDDEENPEQSVHQEIEVLKSFAVNVLDHGAVGDGKSDDTLAIKAAWSLALTMRRKLYFPGNDYRITDTLSGEPISIVGAGVGFTRLIFDKMKGKDGIVFTSPSHVGTMGEVAHLSIIVKGEHGRFAIKTADDSANYHKYRTKYSFHDLEFRGYNIQDVPSGFVYDYGWECYLEIGDSWGVYIDRIDVIGTYNISNDPDSQPNQTFLRLDANSNILTARINSVTTHGIKIGIEIGDKCFFMIDQCDIAHSYKGIITTGEAIYSEGRITDTLINSQYIGIHLKERSWTSISNVAISRHKKGYDHGLDWFGVYLNNVNKSWLTNIRSQSDSSLSKFSGKHYGFYFKNCDGIAANGLIPGGGLDYPIFNNNTSGATFNGANFQISRGVAAFSFVNNSRYIQIGTFENHTDVPDFFADRSINKTTIEAYQKVSIP